MFWYYKTDLVLNLNFYFQPRFVSDTDEIELVKQMQKLEEENREISGDEDSEGDQEGSEEDGDVE